MKNQKKSRAIGVRGVIEPYRYFAKIYRKQSWLLIVWLVLSGILELAGLFMLIPLLGRSAGDSKYQGIAIATILVLFLVISSSCRRLGEKSSSKLRCEIEYLQRSEILEKLLHTPWKSISRLDQADLDTALTSEVSQAANGYLGLLNFLPNLVITIGMFISTLFINPLLSGFSIVIGYIAFQLSRKEAASQSVSQRALSEAYVELNRETSSLITNLKFLRSSGCQEDFLRDTKSRFGTIADLIYFSTNAPSRAKWITDISGVFLLFLILLISVLQDGSIAKSLVFIAVLFRLTPKMQNIQSGWILISQQSIWMKRWTDRLAFFKDSELLPEQDVDILASDRGGQNIVISNVTVAFTDRSRPALRNISVTIGIKERVALVGHSGSGKSTLIDLITGVISPDSGEVRIRGKVLIDETLEKWKKEISWTPQVPALRTGTIYENIAWLGNNVSSESAWIGLRVAELDTFVKSLPHGLGSEINPKTELSGGQGQRLALARAVARGSVLLILDETTSSLDENLETQIASNLAKLDCGVIIATHRLGPLQICTRTIEFDDGVITFDGPTNIYLQKRQRIGCEE